MKTKNEIGDWVQVVAALEQGQTLERASKNFARVVHVSTDVRRPGRTSSVSKGQLKAIRRD